MSSKKILDYYGHTHAGFLHSHGEVSTEILIQKLDIQPNENILEIGFGTGATLVKIASRFPGANYHGLDRSDTMLHKATKRIKFCLLNNTIQLKQIDAQASLNVFEPKMDKIYIESVLGIQEDDELKSMIIKIAGQLKPKGKLIINETIWKDDVSKEEVDKINAACKEAFGIIQSNGKYHAKQLWNDLFIECGFTVKSMEEINIRGLSRKRTNVHEILSAVYSKLGNFKGKFSGGLRTEMEQYQKSMKNIITHDHQVMTGVIFVLEKN